MLIDDYRRLVIIILMIIHYNGIKDTLDNVSIDSINKKIKYRIGYYTSHSFY